MKIFSYITVLVLASLITGKGSPIRIVDANGKPFPDVLVIVKSLSGKGEIGRYLTNKDGQTSQIQFDDDGLYRVIAVCPYGHCQTTVHEFIGTEIRNELLITVPIKPTD